MGYVKDLHMIYESYRGQSQDLKGFTPNVNEPVNALQSLAPTGGQLPTQSPSGSQYAVGVTPAGMEDEEMIEPKRPINHQTLIKLLNKEIYKANTFGMDYAVMVLSELKQQIVKGNYKEN